MKLESKIKPAKEDPQPVTIDLNTEKADVGDVAKAVAGADTPHKDKVAPAAAVVVPVKGLAAGDDEKVRKALAGVKGVTAKEARADKGEAVVPLDAKGGAKLSEIKKALDKLAG